MGCSGTCLCQCVLWLTVNLEVSAAERSLYLKVNKVGKVVLFVLSGQSQLTGFLNSDRQFLTGVLRITNIMWSGF